MGVKEAERKNPRATVPTGEQLRIAKLTADSVDDEDQEFMKRLVKTVIETTRCTKAQAEIALFDNNNDVDSAVNQIFDTPELEWIEQKNKKDKKKEEEIVKPVRGQSASRGGRKEWSDRFQGGGGGGERIERGAPRGRANYGGSNGGTTSFRGSSRGGAQNGRGRGGRQFRQNNDNKMPQFEIPDEENKDWQNGPLIFKRSEETATATNENEAPVPAATHLNGTSSAGPISFAAVAAAGVNKEKQRNEQQHQQQKVQQRVAEKPSASVDEPVHASAEIEASSSIKHAAVEEAAEEKPSVPQTSSAAEWTNKLKSELGIGVTPVEPVYIPPEPAKTVEFVSDAVPAYASGLHEYQFGFHAEPIDTTPVMATNQAPPVQVEAPLFTRSPIVQSSQPPATTVKTDNMPPQDYSTMKSSPTGGAQAVNYAQMQQQQQQQSRALSFDTTSVSYAPPKPHPATTQSMQMQNPPPQQAQQMPYAPAVPYGNYPAYLNMYSPLRSDDAAGYAALMQFPFGVGQIDLTTLLPAQGSLSGGQTQPAPQPQHRSDNHQMMDLNKYAGMNTSRETPVGPPPGFANNGYMPPHAQNVQNLFMPPQIQQYPPSGAYPPFMMQAVSQPPRPMYGAQGEEERKVYDRNAPKTGPQHTPPPHYQQPQQPQHNGYMGGLGKPKQPQPTYGHTWNN